MSESMATFEMEACVVTEVMDQLRHRFDVPPPLITQIVRVALHHLPARFIPEKGSDSSDLDLRIALPTSMRRQLTSVVKMAIQQQAPLQRQYGVRPGRNSSLLTPECYYG